MTEKCLVLQYPVNPNWQRMYHDCWGVEVSIDLKDDSFNLLMQQEQFTTDLSTSLWPPNSQFHYKLSLLGIEQLLSIYLDLLGCCINLFAAELFQDFNPL